MLRESYIYQCYLFSTKIFVGRPGGSRQPVQIYLWEVTNSKIVKKLRLLNEVQLYSFLKVSMELTVGQITMQNYKLLIQT